jgi:hypothetical protein
MEHVLSDNASYFFLPGQHDRPAEIIVTYGEQQTELHIPSFEEDIYLRSFLHRKLSSMEMERMKSGKKVRVYYSWEKLIEDHTKFGITTFLKTLRNFEFLKAFPEEKLCIQDIFNYKRIHN